jgi:hypothetical protein
LAEERLAFDKQLRPRGREADVAAVALQQRHAELCLESPHLLAERRLRDVESFCRAAEVQLLGDRDEVIDEPQIEAFHSPSLLIRRELILDPEQFRAHP